MYHAATLISSLGNASQEEIVELMLRKWLEYYKTDQVCPYLRLKDYKIEKVSIQGYCFPPDKNTSKFSAQVEFSIQTVTAHPGDWEAFPGNITRGVDHWIYHLAPYVGISAANGVYYFSLEGGTGCS